MIPGDLADIIEIARQVHPAYPEDDAVLAERRALFPEGCLVLGDARRIQGYVLSHPWLFLKPPKLNTRLEALPENPTTYYLHDVAIAPEVRGTGHAARIVRNLSDVARALGLPTMSLVAVHDSVSFWERLDFRQVRDERLDEQLRSYDPKARFMERDLTR